LVVHDALFNPGPPPAKNLLPGYIGPKSSKLGCVLPFLRLFLTLGRILLLVDLFLSGGIDGTFLF
jgi:hypothetical protein